MAAQRIEAYYEQLAHRPFGEAELESRRTLSLFSRAGLTAADNLLTKAARALVEGDQERVGHFVNRAVALGYDEHEQTVPAACAAGMLLFCAVTDELEDSEEGDAAWLEAALAAMAAGSGWGQSEMRHVLVTVMQDYAVTPRESQLVRAAIAGVPERTELRDTTMTGLELVEAVTSVLHMLNAYLAALEFP